MPECLVGILQGFASLIGKIDAGSIQASRAQAFTAGAFLKASASRPGVHNSHGLLADATVNYVLRFG